MTSSQLSPGSRIFVAGHRGLAGSAIVRALRARGHHNLLLRTHSELDLTRRDETFSFFAEEAPEFVILAAAKVGGIRANDSYPADFIRENLLIQTNVIDACWKHGVKRLLFLGSSCVYPRDCPQPIREEYLLTGPLEITNRAYAIAKIAGIEMCDAYNRQHGTEYICAMPTNLYGAEDNFDPETSHVLPAMLGKFIRAVRDGHAPVTLWGTGTALREFMHADDFADACVHIMNRPQADLPIPRTGDQGFPIINIGTEDEVSIRELAAMVQRATEHGGTVIWDSSRPDGTPRKKLDNSRIRQLNWKPTINLADGIKSLAQELAESELLNELAQEHPTASKLNMESEIVR